MRCYHYLLLILLFPVLSGRNAYSQYPTDCEASIITEPAEEDTLFQKISFPLTAFFQNDGEGDLYNVQVRFLIKRCSDNQIVFKADSSIPLLFANSSAVEVTFPSKQGNNDVRKLLPGCYLAEAVVRVPYDYDHSNDTAFENFFVQANALDNDMAADSILLPVKNPDFPPNLPVAINVRFRNVGLTNASQFTEAVHIYDNNGNIAYSNTTYEDGDWLPGESRDITFAPFVTSVSGPYTLVAISQMGNDEYLYNDTLITKFSIGNPCEVGVISITEPLNGTTLIPGTVFTPTARVRWETTAPKQDIPFFLTIRSCEDGSVVYFQFSAIFRNQITSNDFKMSFDPVANLPDGCYEVSIMSVLSCDTDTSNNYATSTINIHISNDISIDSIISPIDIRYLNTQLPSIRCMMTNRGFLDASHAPVTAVITDPFGAVVYRDTVLIDHWSSGQEVEADFAAFIPKEFGTYSLKITSLYSPDRVHRNDTVSRSFGITGESDVAAYAVLSPAPNAIIHPGQIFQPKGLFKVFFGLKDLYNIPVTCQIIRCTDQVLLFQSSSVIPRLLQDSPTVQVSFPTRENSYDIRNLPVGCYELHVIASYPTDEDHTDDTAYISFSVFGSDAVQNNNSMLANGVILNQNFPNPFATTTTIEYSLPENGNVMFTIYDITGRIIRSEPGTQEEAGAHSINLSLAGLPSGVYIYELAFTNENGEKVRRSQRMTVIK